MKGLEMEVRRQALSQPYVVPTGCPIGDRALSSTAWAAFPEHVFRLLYPVVTEEEWEGGSIKMHGVVITWACAGCTVGAGNDEQDCHQRKCGLGGKPCS